MFELLPEGWVEETAEALLNLRTELKEQAASLRQKDTLTNDDVTLAKAIVDAVRSIDGELARRDEAKAEIDATLSLLDEVDTEDTDTAQAEESAVEDAEVALEVTDAEEAATDASEEVAEVEELTAEVAEESVEEADSDDAVEEVAELETAEVTEVVAEEAPEVAENSVAEEVAEAAVETEDSETITETPAEVAEAAVEETVADETEVVETETEQVEELGADAEVAEEVTELTEAEITEADADADAELTNEELAGEETVAEETNTEESTEMSKTDGALEGADFYISKAAEPETNVRATAGATTKPVGESFESMGELGAEIAASWKRYGGESRWNNLSRGAYSDTVMFASIQNAAADGMPTLTSLNESANMLALNQAVQLYNSSNTGEALVASGGLCAPLNVDYNFFRLAQPQSPVESFLPTIGAPRGGIKWLNTPDFTQARNAITTVTAAQDYIGYPLTPDADKNSTYVSGDRNDPTSWNPDLTPNKPCIMVECPGTSEVTVTAVPYCVRWGNFNYYTFPEMVENFFLDLWVNYAKVKEVFYLDAIDAASTAVTAASTLGATRSLLDHFRRAAINYRKRHHMPNNSTLQVLLPDWAVELLKQDLVNNHDTGDSHLVVSDAELGAALNALGLQVATYYHSATAGGMDFNGTQAAGALNAWPATVVSYMFAPGTFVRLDGGSLDFGLVRDSTLIATNDLIIAAEQFTGVAKVGLESLKITHTVAPSGAGKAGI